MSAPDQLGEEVVLSSQVLLPDEASQEAALEALEAHQLWAGDQQNVLALALLLCLALITNLSAAPVILFRRTRFGNGQFAVLVLCLTMADMLTVLCGLVGGLVLELGHMTWAGTSTGREIKRQIFVGHIQ